ncbi:MAG: LysR family transcriptional regulator [Edaphobacter sp.]|uniref:LysR family transcriptional regulator n=1 Tax=Edaphobacter sp. TaxID=1934404 RepID=UPI0023A4753F|nr:LysR family transcriptional regulator [Edaphobacter sp.]MDE1177453.1 LysR family transcriptional regulator [Edaphobacter sp.]
MDVHKQISWSFSQLRAFRIVAEYSSFTKAAEQMEVTQPYISGQISSLEARVGAPLFNRVGRRAYLNAAGKMFLPYAIAILDRVRDADRAIDAFRGLSSGYVTIAASSTPGAYILPRILRQFLSDYPGIRITVHIKDQLHVEQLLLRQEAEIGVIASEPASPELEPRLLGIDRVLLICSPDHRLNRGVPIHLRELENECLIVREETSGTRILTEQEFKKANLSPLSKIEFTNNDAIKEAVMEGLGVAFVSQRSVRTDLKSRNLVAIPIEDYSAARPLMLLTNAGQPLSPAATVLRNLIVADAARDEAQQ